MAEVEKEEDGGRRDGGKFKVEGIGWPGDWPRRPRRTRPARPETPAGPAP
jgi:hypothetical protein